MDKIDYNKVSIYDGAPISDCVPPISEGPRDPENSYDAVNAQVRHTHRIYAKHLKYTDEYDPVTGKPIVLGEHKIPDTGTETTSFGPGNWETWQVDELRHIDKYDPKTGKQVVLDFKDPSASFKNEGWNMELIQGKTNDPLPYNERANRISSVAYSKNKTVCPSDDGGPLQGALREFIEERIRWHTGADEIQHLRSWWSLLTKKIAVPKHSHTYQTDRRTVSGICWVQGDICPLYIKNPGDKLPDLVNNVPGRLVIFSASTDHWTEAYTSDNLRAGISFDYLIPSQKGCECGPDGVCIRCAHINLEKLNIKGVYAGGSTTVKFNMDDDKFVTLDNLPKEYK